MDIIVEVEKKVLVNIDGGRGPKGDDGADGATGPKGDKGDTGDTGPQGLPGSADITKTSDLINDGESGSPFITFEDLPSNISLFATNAVSDISGYLKLVTTLDDLDYNDVGVDINTGAITTANQLIASLAASPNLFVGNPGIINITTLGEIRRISGTASALFYFELYKRTLAGVETLISTSNNTAGITNSVYEQFSTTALLNNGSFISTDRLVLKFYGSKVGGGSNPTFNFLFGGSNPVRTSIPVPLTAIPALTKSDIGLGNVDNTSDVNKPISNDTQTSLNLKVDKVAGERLINASEITKLVNQSGVNTGDQDLSGLAVKANNLSDLTNAATARTNLGLGTLATQNGTFSGSSSGTNTGDQNDHGLMTGLLDDDHTQYMLLSGRVGGQTLSDRLSLSVPTLTGSLATSALSISQTYNTTGSPTLIFANITNIASGPSTKLMDLQFGGASVLDVRSNRIHVGIGTGAVGDFTTPALLLGSTLNNGFYLDTSRISIKSGGQFVGAFTSTGFIGGSGLFSNVTANDLITPIFRPYRITSNGLTSGIGGNSTGELSLITNNISIIFLGFAGEIGIGTTAPNVRSILDVQSTTKGLLFPRMTTAQRNAIATVAGDAGLTIFNTTTTKLEVWDGTTWQSAW